MSANRNAPCTKLRAVIGALLVWLICALPTAALDLTSYRSAVDLTRQLRFAADPTADLSTMLERFRAGTFSDALSVDMLATNYAPEVWAAVEIFNDTLDDGRAPDPYALLLDLPLVSEVDLYLVHEDGLTESLLSYSIFAPFDPAQHSVTRLRSAELQIAPQARAVVMANLKFGPFHSFRLHLQTPSEIESSGLNAGIGVTAFYAFSIACLLFFVAFFVALKDWMSLLYATLYLIGLGLIAYIDGLLFRFLYPLRPDLQSAVGFFLVFALSGAGFLLAGHGLSHYALRLAQWVRALALLSLAGFLMSLASPGTYVAFLSYVLLGIMFAVVPVGTSAWRQSRGTTQTTALVLMVITTVAILVVVGALATGWLQQIVPLPLAIKAIYAAALLATLTNFAAHILAIRREHAQAVAARIDALEQEAKRSQELLEAEKNYSRARDLARLRQRQLATASHDLKQPLTSLRMTLDSLGGQMDPALRSRMAEAFDYMEALSGEYLRDAARAEDAGEHEDDPSPPLDTPEAEDPYPLSLILQTLHQMFQQEAISKGLRLTVVASSIQTTLPPLVLMRIVSNLVSNAVAHTETGRVLAGVRRRPTGAEIQICDTGQGMNAAEIARFAEAGQKGEKSQGHGLGLAVCHALAAEHGLDLTVRSVPGRGTVFRLIIPTT